MGPLVTGVRVAPIAAVMAVVLCVCATPARAVQHDVDAPVRFTPQSDAVLTVDGARYRGSVEVVRDPGGGGLDVVNVVNVDDYMRGVAEMPSAWPRAALEAQAIVNRTQLAHALASGRSAAPGGYDLSSDASGAPPYRGAGVESQEWDAALESTDALVLRTEGRPAEVHSHATSPGGTDAGSPLATWSVRMPAQDVGEALAAGGVALPGGGASVSLRLEGGDVVVTTAGGATRMSPDAFARAVNSGAPERQPGRYPPVTDEQIEDGLTGGDGWGGPWPPPAAAGDEATRLPLTLPSPRFEISSEGDSYTFTGTGWGSGLGMSKSVARQLADAGRSRDEILAAAFPGRTIETDPISGDVRVGVVLGADEVHVGVEGGFFRIAAPGAGSEPVASAAFGDWTVSAGPGRSIALVGPDGADAALAVNGFTVPLRIVANRHLPVMFTLSRPADVTLVVDGPLGAQSRTERHDLGVMPAGEAQQVGLDDLRPGAYNVSIEATAGDVTVTGNPMTVDVTPVRRGPSVVGAVGLVLLLAGLLVGAVSARRRRRTRVERSATRPA